MLEGIISWIDEEQNFRPIVTALDKYDKISWSAVVNDLEKIISQEKIQKLGDLFAQTNQLISNLGILRSLERILNNESGQQGVKELLFIIQQAAELGVNNMKIELVLARGLDYYTGSIIEVKGVEYKNSICGGGRYDDLTGIFGLPNVSGVGISFGADRIYDVLEEIGGFFDFSNVSTKIMFVNFGEEEAKHCMKLVKRLRDDGVNTELYPDAAKMKKQLSYADAKKIPYVALIGYEEIKTGEITIKNISSGEHSKVTMEKLLEILK